MGEPKLRIKGSTERVVGLYVALCLAGLFSIGCLYPAKNLKRGQAVVDDQMQLILGETTMSDITATFGQPGSI
jgi:hypothetical protein